MKNISNHVKIGGSIIHVVSSNNLCGKTGMESVLTIGIVLKQSWLSMEWTFGVGL